MALGTVTWFSAQSGFGFIEPFDGSVDIFVHISEIERAGLTALQEGQKVRYEAIVSHGKQVAEHLSLAE
jgi:CspA family cold shock protein